MKFRLWGFSPRRVGFAVAGLIYCLAPLHFHADCQGSGAVFGASVMLCLIVLILYFADLLTGNGGEAAVPEAPKGEDAVRRLKTPRIYRTMAAEPAKGRYLPLIIAIIGVFLHVLLVH